MKHEHDEIFASLRAELNLQLDDNMASYIASEPRSKIADGAESAKGRAFAAEVARNHGVAGVRSMHRCLSDVGYPLTKMTLRRMPRSGSNLRAKVKASPSVLKRFVNCQASSNNKPKAGCIARAGIAVPACDRERALPMRYFYARGSRAAYFHRS
jgi:hypothetical protein